MNYLVSLLLILLLWMASRELPVEPASDADVIKTIRTSLLTGDAGQLSACFAKTIELVIDAEKVDFPALSTSHAELILRSFFRKHPPQGFRFVHQGTSARLHYRTGTYTTDGQTFTVYILMRRTTNRQYVINTLHFRKK